MLWVGEKLVDRRLFRLAPGVHDDDTVGNVGDDPEIVRDENDRRPESIANLAHQVQDPRLDRDVECRRRLVRDENLRVARQCGRDHHPLSHPTRQLMWILVHPAFRRRDPHEVEQLDRALARFAP